MRLTHSDLLTVTKRFPNQEKSIKQLFLQNKSFRAICDDYCKCQNTLLHLARPGQDNLSIPVNEYVLLLNELEAEIIEKLDECME